MARITPREVGADLDVELLGRDVVHRLADPNAGVVREHVEAPEALAVSREQRDDLVLLGHLRRDRVDVEARRRAARSAAASSLSGRRAEIVTP